MRPYHYSVFLFIVSCLLLQCKKPVVSCSNKYKGDWQFKTTFSKNGNIPYDSIIYTGKIIPLNNDSLQIFYTSVDDYPIDLDCSTGALLGSIYQGNHGNGSYQGIIDSSMIHLVMLRIPGFPPYDSNYQVITGVKRSLKANDLPENFKND